MCKAELVRLRLSAKITVDDNMVNFPKTTFLASLLDRLPGFLQQLLSAPNYAPLLSVLNVSLIRLFSLALKEPLALLITDELID